MNVYRNHMMREGGHSSACSLPRVQHVQSQALSKPERLHDDYSIVQHIPAPAPSRARLVSLCATKKTKQRHLYKQAPAWEVSCEQSSRHVIGGGLASQRLFSTGGSARSCFCTPPHATAPLGERAHLSTSRRSSEARRSLGCL